ncbi:MAG: choice-of-anchor D domain-containing protein, partial [Persicimonas sp.]
MQSWTRKIRRLFFLLLFVGFASSVGCASCEDGDGGISQGTSGSLTVQPLSVNFSQIPIGETAREQVTITNAHTDDPLRVLDIKLRASENSTVDDLQLVDVPSKDFEIAAGESRVVEVEHTAQGQANSGIIEIYSTDPNYRGDRPYEVDVSTIPNSPRLVADPSAVRFPRLPPGDSDEQTLTIRNEGTAPLIIHEASYSGGSDFQVDDIIDDGDDEIVLDPYDGPLADENPERFELVIPVQYRPQEDGGDSGEIIIVSNDTRDQSNDDDEGVHIVDVQANADAPCILVDGKTRSFGQVPIGAVVTEVVRVTNCGSQTLDIEGVDLSENSDDDEFSLELGSWDSNGDGQVDSAIRLDPGEDDTFEIDYGPTQVGSDTGEVVIRSNDHSQQELELELVGRGSDGECPEAKVTAKVRGQDTSPRSTITAAPLDYIILDGSTSEDPDGRVVDYEWEPLEAPDDSTINLSET